MVYKYVYQGSEMCKLARSISEERTVMAVLQTEIDKKRYRLVIACSHGCKCADQYWHG